MKKIILLSGSPHKKGTSAYLAEQFTQGACKQGHEVVRYDVGDKIINGCLGCGYCRSHGDECIQKDGMEEIIAAVLNADVIVFVTPLYFMSMSSQLKAVVDRFYAINLTLQKMSREGVKKECLLLSTCGAKNDGAADALVLNYQMLYQNFGWENKGMVIAQGYDKREEIIDSSYAKKAYSYGLSL